MPIFRLLNLKLLQNQPAPAPSVPTRKDEKPHLKVSQNQPASDPPDPTRKNEIPHWVEYNGYQLPNGAVTGGFRARENVYIGRAVHRGTLTPGMLFEFIKRFQFPFNSINSRKRCRFNTLPVLTMGS